MALFYGGSIGFGGSAAPSVIAGVYWGTRGAWGGGHWPTIDSIDYCTIASGGGSADFGNLHGGARRFTGGVSNGDGGRGLFGGGTDGSPEPSGADEIEYITLQSLGDSINFGSFYNSQHMQGPGTGGDGNRGLWIGAEELTGPGAYYNPQISYSTIASAGDSLEFGEMVTGEGGSHSAGVMDGVYCRYAMGSFAPSPYAHDRISSVTVQTLGDAVDWGDLTLARYTGAAISSDAGRGVFCNGYREGASPYNTEILDYITIATMNNALDFGDSRVACDSGRGVQNGPRGVWNFAVHPTQPTNEMGYITIASLGNSADFGDQHTAKAVAGSVSAD